MAMVRVLFFLSATFLTFLAGISAAPRRYDQRQQGEFNVHAQLENLLFVVAVPGNNDFLSELALQALELKHHLGSPGRVIPPSSSKAHESEDTFEESNDELRGEEVYITSTSTTVQANEDRPAKKESLHDAKEKNAEPSDASSQQQQATTGEETREEKAEGAIRTAKSTKGFELIKSQQMPVILGYLVDIRTLGSKMEGGGRARNVIGNVWNPDVEPGRPGTLMKKQLSRRGLDEEDAAPLATSNKNDTTLAGEKQQELRLLGDGVENCGPGRRRDATGVCGFDKSDDPLS
ncbi:uncharacterized protein LOC105185334 [Harpegnathos saltator]|uniref:uncharacterized protein LOC105185334 n=1 Tax=Harpegnathos saltator TaxID=610380 RepID=UPI0005916C1A|nr:uncharacterized protein LOC105185334 [Harpegnathos saltator]